MLQTNRSDAELRYWRVLPGEREISFGVRGDAVLLGRLQRGRSRERRDA